jgi:hypothetical protein
VRSELRRACWRGLVIALAVAALVLFAPASHVFIYQGF